MDIGGFQSLSLVDFPGRVAAIVFTQGCNFCCPFCHNGGLVPRQGNHLVPEEEVFSTLSLRQDTLDGVVITGGEPTLQDDLEGFLGRLRSMRFETKLDTNGSNPAVVKRLIEKNLLTYIAMDLKAPLEKYHDLAGTSVTIDNIIESIGVIASSGLEHEFRTTYVQSLLSEDDMEAIERYVPQGSTYRRQEFNPAVTLDPSLS